MIKPPPFPPELPAGCSEYTCDAVTDARLFSVTMMKDLFEKWGRGEGGGGGGGREKRVQRIQVSPLVAAARYAPRASVKLSPSTSASATIVTRKGAMTPSVAVAEALLSSMPPLPQALAGAALRGPHTR